MDLTFLGGASEVGASCTLLHFAGHRLLIDGGMRSAAKAGQSRLPDLALLEHGLELFRRDGPTWTPFEEQRVLSNAGFVHHLDLLEAGANTPVLINGRRGTLTGRSSWRYFEVRWEEGEEAGELTRVRGHNVQIV